jgi:predicted permease
MNIWRRFRRWRGFHDDLDEELRVHLEMASKERIDMGQSPVEAARQARAEFGNPLLIKEVTRDLWGFGWFDYLGQDLRFAARQIRRSPGFCAVVILTLAFGIGLNTTMFSIINAILFQPIHARDPEETVAVFTSISRDARYGSSSYLDYVDVRDRSADTFQDLAAYSLEPAELRIGESAQHISAGLVSANYFRFLGAGALAGRTFLPEEDRLLDPRSVVILSEATWREHFSADPAIIGKSVRLNQQSFTVIGVVDARFCRLRHFIEVELFIPATSKDLLDAQPNVPSDQTKAFSDREPRGRGGTPSQPTAQGGLRSRRDRQFFLLGRRALGVSIEQAQAKVRLIAAQLHREEPDAWSTGDGEPGTIIVVSEATSRVPPQARLGVIALSIFLLGVVGTVLLMACTNLANLSLARALSRRTEIAVRISVGASRWRVIRQLLVESLALSLMGAGAALLLTRSAASLLTAYRPPLEISLGLDLVIDHRVLLFALFVTLLTTILFGLAPALHASGSDVVSALKESAVLGHYRHFSFRNMLIVAEVSMSIVLLMPAGLFLRSLQNVRDLDVGFRRDHLALISITLDAERYPPERGKLAYREIAERLRRTPGVEQADLASTVPLSGMFNARGFLRAGSDEAPRTIAYNTVGPRYFETMGIPLLRGRSFDGVLQNQAVAVVNSEFAREFWPNGENPIGKRIAAQGESGKPIEIIGVVGTGKYADLTESPTPYIYRPIEQEYSSSATFHIRTKIPPKAMLNRLLKEIQAYDTSLPVFDSKTMEEQLEAMAPYQALAVMLGIFGALSVVISFAGLYGLIAYQTAVRTREIGIRAALGASPVDILALMATQGLRLVVVGIMIGVPASIAVGQLISRFLFGVAPLDLKTYVEVPVIMGVVALAAIVIPAARGMRIDPWSALRTT